MQKLKLTGTPLDGCFVVETDVFRDNRGEFSRFFCSGELSDILQNRSIVQINRSLTHAMGAVRGMHFQNPPYCEMKLVRCLRGRVWDVAVDLRKNSRSFLKWFAVELTPNNAKMIVIPEGFAHGFQVLEEDSELLYLHTKMYTPGSEGGVMHDDPLFQISWPLPATDLSARDNSHPYLTNEFTGIEV